MRVRGLMKLPRAYARGIFPPLLRREQNPSEAEKQLRIHPRPFGRGFLRRGIKHSSKVKQWFPSG
jgi:hypothetical protein